MESEIITSRSPISPRRRYRDACAAAHALDLVGDRWALLVIRELMLGPRRFGELRAGLPGISANVLDQRLDELAAAGILVRHAPPAAAAAPLYALTGWGYEAEPIFQALGRWAARSPAHDPTLPFSAASLLLSLRTMFDPARAGGLRAVIAFQIGVKRHRIRVADGQLRLDYGRRRAANVTFSATAAALAAAIYGGETIAALESAGALRVDGDRALAERFVTLFPLPPKAAAEPGSSRVPALSGAA